MDANFFLLLLKNKNFHLHHFEDKNFFLKNLELIFLK